MADYDIIVIGGGPAGLTAAVYGARAGKRVLVLERMNPGGQIVYAPLVENYPGMPGMSGADYAAALTEQAERFGVEIACEEALELKPGTPTEVVTDAGVRTCGAAILATGTEHRRLGLDNEEDLIGAGISYCAVCDGAFYADREVVVIGGGNSALQEAVFLSEICKKVTLVHRRTQFRADECLIGKLKQRGNVECLTPYVPVEILQQDDAVCGMVLCNAESGEERRIDAEGVFVAVGQEPCSGPFRGLGLCGADGYYAAGEDTLTGIPGVFVAGDGRRKSIRQLVTACSDGAAAAMAACRYLEEREN